MTLRPFVSPRVLPILSRRCNPLLIPKDRRSSSDRITLTLNPRVIFRRY